MHYLIEPLFKIKLNISALLNNNDENKRDKLQRWQSILGKTLQRRE